MFTTELQTTNPDVVLVEPNVERDAPLSVYWLADPHGRHTLKMMGVPDKDNHASDLDAEIKRVEGFLANTDQYNWSIRYQDTVIGAVWVDLESHEGLGKPSVHIMLGDPVVRGKGIGGAATEAIIGYLYSKGNAEIYSRYLLINRGSQHLLSKYGFVLDGDAYIDADGLHWQNVVLVR